MKPKEVDLEQIEPEDTQIESVAQAVDMMHDERPEFCQGIWSPDDPVPDAWRNRVPV